MSARIFRLSFLAFLIVLALVAGGAFYQAISIVPFWEKDLSMFKNYGHWGIDYFPLLSPLMTALWLILVISGIKVQLPQKRLLYLGHFFFLLMMGSTFAYFAPFLLTHMGHPQNISDGELDAQLQTWARWDLVRQIVGLIPLSIFIYMYGKSSAATTRMKSATA